MDGRTRLPLATTTRVSAAFEMSPDDPRQVTEATAHAAESARDGLRMAVVCHGPPPLGGYWMVTG